MGCYVFEMGPLARCALSVRAHPSMACGTTLSVGTMIAERFLNCDRNPPTTNFNFALEIFHVAITDASILSVNSA